MNKILAFVLCVFITFSAHSQAPGIVDKKSKEFFITPNSKLSYQIYGYQYPNNTTLKMICFSTNANEVRENDAKCPLGAYFNTSMMKEGGKILYAGKVGSFGKMTYVFGGGKKTVFYLPVSAFAMK